MKPSTICMAIAIAFVTYQNVSAQQAADNLKKYCAIHASGRFIIDNASSGQSQNIEMSEYGSDVPGDEFAAEMAILYQWGKANIALNNVAGDMWLLVSKQIHGESGLLTLSKINFIPTKDEKGEAILAIVAWDKTIQKWAILSHPLKLGVLYKGVRMFALKS